MSIVSKLSASLPKPLRRMIKPITRRVFKKHFSEMVFWQNLYDKSNGTFDYSILEKTFLAIAEQPNDDFLKGKIVADFGCGPSGSLAWAKSAHLRIGIDVIADRYVDAFTDCTLSHDMIYLKSTEKVIPLPSELVDVMFTRNAMDHVDNFSEMCNEVLRIMKPGAMFIGSFNLEEPVSLCEPQQLNEKIIEESLLCKLDVQYYQTAARRPNGDPYKDLSEGAGAYVSGQEGFLWVRGIKKSADKPE